MKELFTNFCENSSLHGFPHLVNKKKAFPEKVFWFVFLTATIFLLVSQVLSERGWLLSSTVVSVIENPHYDLSAVEFPAVTVCPNINVMNSKVDLLLKRYHFSEKNYSSFRNTLIALSLMKLAYYNLPLAYVNSINANVYPIKNEDIERIMVAVKPDLDTMIESCTLKSKQVDCNKLFRLQLMPEGFCYSFNSKTAYRSTQDPMDLPPFELPNKTLVGFKTSMFGITSGIGFRVKALAHETLNNSLFGDYYSIFIHNPSLIPDSSSSYMFTIPSNDPLNRNYIGISASVVEADKSLNYMEESLRGCQFNNGPKATYYCVLKCKIYSILMYCRCLPYYFYDFKKEPNLDVCGLGHLKCLSDLTGFFHTYGVPKGIPGFPDWIRSWDTQCHCLQACSYISYTPKLETYQKKLTRVDPGWTRVDIFYNQLAVKYSRRASYLFREFIVNCGNISNLLLGFSAVAAVDFCIFVLKFFKRAFVELFRKRNGTKIVIKPKMGSKRFIKT